MVLVSPELPYRQKLEAAEEYARELEALRCPICHDRGGHSLSCPTRWYPKV